MDSPTLLLLSGSPVFAVPILEIEMWVYLTKCRCFFLPVVLTGDGTGWMCKDSALPKLLTDWWWWCSEKWAVGVLRRRDQDRDSGRSCRWYSLFCYFGSVNWSGSIELFSTPYSVVCRNVPVVVVLDPKRNAFLYTEIQYNGLDSEDTNITISPWEQ